MTVGRERQKGKKKLLFLTTHQAAQLLGVSLPTIVNWIGAGRLNAYRTPGGHRRIPRGEIIRFSRAFSYPLPAEFTEESGPLRVLVIDSDRDLGEMVRDYLLMQGNYEVRLAAGLFEAGYLIGGFKPQVVLLDLSLPGLDALGVLRLIRDDEHASVPLVFAVASVRNLRNERLLSSFDGLLEKPLRLDQLLEKLPRV
ncbi:MAG: excisionase family DNA-binding protein [Myxococcota bacterium]|nr:excisionase family DNA-binding protein [Myxococcota bacterium]